MTISSVTLDADTRIMNDKAIQMLFVEYRFLGVDLMELETPYSLPKPAPGNSIVFNFRKSNYFLCKIYIIKFMRILILLKKTNISLYCHKINVMCFKIQYL